MNIDESKLNLKQKLDQIALKQGVGYKTANLQIMKELFDEEKECEYKVPQFDAIPSNIILTLFKELNVDILEEYLKVIIVYKEFPILSLPNNFIEKVNLISSKILETVYDKEKLWILIVIIYYVILNFFIIN